VKILEVILNQFGTDAILQGTDWTKDWLDWVNMIPLLQAQLPLNPITKQQPTLQQVKANLDAWRQANPDKFPNDAWTELGGKGPAPTPSEKMKGRDLRLQPPDDSGTWINGGSYWTHAIPPFIHAIKPDPTNKHTWGPTGGDNSYIPIDTQISIFRPEIIKSAEYIAFQAKVEAEIKNMPNKTPQDQMAIQQYRKEMLDKETNRQIEARLRAIPGKGPGGKMYSNREINDGMRDELGAFNFNSKLDLHNNTEIEKAKKAAIAKEAEEYKWAQRYYKKHEKTCPDGWIRNRDDTACIRDPNEVPEPEEDQDGNMTCRPGWKYNEATRVCVKDEAVTPAPVEPPVEPPAPVNEKINMIFPVGSPNIIIRGLVGNHEGLDIADQLKTIKYGTKVVAPEDGTVFYVMTQPGTPGQNGYGLNVKLRSKDGKREHVFGHLSRAIPAGPTYKQGDPIAEVGGIGKQYTTPDGTVVPANQDPRPGESDGVHLHWGVKEEGKVVNPLKYFKK